MVAPLDVTNLSLTRVALERQQSERDIPLVRAAAQPIETGKGARLDVFA